MKPTNPTNNPPGTASNLDLVQSSKSTAMSRMIIAVHAPVKHGKTFLAATASQFFPASLPSPTDVELDDLLWLTFDVGALDGFTEVGLSVPQIDVTSILASTRGDIFKATDLAMQAAQAYIQRGLTSWIVVDTVSSLDRMLNEYWERNNPASGTGEEKFVLYRMIASSHAKFYTNLTLIAPRIIFLFHSTAKFDTDDKARRKTRATAMPGESAIVPEITGKSRGTYLANCSLELALRAVKDPSSKTIKRTVYPYGGMDFEGGGRFHQSLGQEEPANLTHILAKIKTGRPKSG